MATSACNSPVVNPPAPPAARTSSSPRRKRLVEMQGVAVAGNREVLIDVVASAVVCFVERIELARVAAQLIR